MAERKMGTGWRRRFLVAAVWVGVAAGAYTWGRFSTTPTATAVPPASAAKATAKDTGPAVPEVAPSPEYSRRIVAHLYDGKVNITREELGEYLIARCGKERVRNLINKRIIEHTARQARIEITPAEIDAGLKADVASLGVTAKEFEEQLLKRYNKSLYEWKEDVIKPRLIMERMCRSKVTVTGEDLSKAHEAHFGEKVECQMIMWPTSEHKHVLNHTWPKIRNSAVEFDRAARSQASPSLAANAGKLKPIGRYTTGDEKLEEIMFSLRKDEVSQVYETPEGIIVVKCLGRVPPDTKETYEQRRAFLEKEVMDRKVNQEIAKTFQELYASAKAVDFLNPTSVVENVKNEFNAAGAPASKKATVIAEPAAPVAPAAVAPAPVAPGPMPVPPAAVAPQK